MSSLEQKTIVEIRAPNNGAVEDVNIYGIDHKLLEKIRGDLEGIAFFSNKSKAEVEHFKLRKDADEGGIITIESQGTQLTYYLHDALIDVTYGGLAYNTFQDLNALDHSLDKRLLLRPVIGLPQLMIQKLKKEGIESADYFLTADVRKSLMMVSDRMQLNIVTRASRVYQQAADLEVPCAAVITSYPQDATKTELDKIRDYLMQRQNLQLYFNPGGTQVRMGVKEFEDILGFVTLITMKLDEAGQFLGIESKTGLRTNFARECLDTLLAKGLKFVVLNDSENGSYLGNENGIYHTPPYPKQPILDIAKNYILNQVENFSGCGDCIFSVMLYSLETNQGLSVQERLALSSAFARLISLMPESNFYKTNNGLISDIVSISKNYVDKVKSLESVNF